MLMNCFFIIFVPIKYKALCWVRDEQKAFRKIHVNTEL